MEMAIGKLRDKEKTNRKERRQKGCRVHRIKAKETTRIIGSGLVMRRREDQKKKGKKKPENGAGGAHEQGKAFAKT